jgi:hypothetical protein
MKLSASARECESEIAGGGGRIVGYSGGTATSTMQ